MGTRQDRALNLYGTHRLGVTAVDTGSLGDNALAHELLFQGGDKIACLGKGLGLFGKGRISSKAVHDCLLDSGTCILAGHLVGNAQRFLNAGRCGKLFNFCNQGRIILMGREVHLGLAGLCTQLFLGFHHGQDLHAGPFKGVDEHVLRHKVRLALDHGQGIGGGCKDQLQVAFLALGKGGVEHKLAVDASHAGTNNRALKRQGGHVDGSRGCGHGQHVGIVFLVS